MPDKEALRNIRLELEYNGARYCGWQVQNSCQLPVASCRKRQKKSIQEVVEKAIFKITGSRVKLIVSGRTDAGVHALAQIANFYTSSLIPPDKLRLGLNALLPSDIKVSCVREVPFDFHSRFSSKAKLYRYTVLNRGHSSPLMEGKVFFYPHPLNLRLMRSESRCLLGRHDFTSFQAALGRDKNPVKHIKSIKISQSGDLVRIDIEADGFLYNMVRNIAGTLIQAAAGRFPRGRLREILKAKDRRLAGRTAPACGLCLLRVKY
jgi:tRNA pseudouridine38-40 synthase